MKFEEYRKKKRYWDTQYLEVDNAMDDLGFTEYHDKTGSSGYRRYYNDKNEAFEVWVIDMEPDIRGEYPDGQFLGRSKSGDFWIENKKDLDLFISNPLNIAFKVN